MNVKFAATGILSLAALGASYSALRAQEAEPHTVWDGVYTAAQATRGEGLYGQHCASCHGRIWKGMERRFRSPAKTFFDLEWREAGRFV